MLFDNVIRCSWCVSRHGSLLIREGLWLQNGPYDSRISLESSCHDPLPPLMEKGMVYSAYEGLATYTLDGAAKNVIRVL